MSSSESNFNGFTRETLAFLHDLELNNNKAWFEANKHRFLAHVKLLFQGLIYELNPTIMKIDPQLEVRPDKVMSRIYRDTRFARDKSPYKTTMWITYKRPNKDWQDCPGYFFELSSKSYRYGMGFYSATRTTMDHYRMSISENPDLFMRDFNAILAASVFVIEGDTYKRNIPNDLPEGLQKWYNRKNMYLVCNRKIDKEVFSDGIAVNLKQGFEILQYLYYHLLTVKK